MKADNLTLEIRELVNQCADGTDSLNHSHKAVDSLYNRVIAEVDKRLLGDALLHTRGNITAASEQLGMHRSTFRKKAIAARLMPRIRRSY